MPSSLDIQNLFKKYNGKYFGGKLKDVRIAWSEKMTLCAGKTYMRQRDNTKLCNITLSKPLLDQRPPHDTVNTLLHEMIHAYLGIVKGNTYVAGHGEEFKLHMKRINDLEGSKITIFHTFHKEVNKFRVHVYKCNGPCRSQRPFFGVIRRAITRPPGPKDKWWEKHTLDCGGTFIKVKDIDDIQTNLESTSAGRYESSQIHGRQRESKLIPIQNNIKSLSTAANSVFHSSKIEENLEFKLVDADVNINYKSPIKDLNIQKYLSRYAQFKGITGDILTENCVVPSLEYSKLTLLNRNLENLDDNKNVLKVDPDIQLKLKYSGGLSKLSADSSDGCNVDIGYKKFKRNILPDKTVPNTIDRYFPVKSKQKSSSDSKAGFSTSTFFEENDDDDDLFAPVHCDHCFKMVLHEELAYHLSVCEK